ncbi:TonB-dependent siderophore receptor [Scytonema sp. NUACC26]|uniref:TonB-dependent siderophore receptor n=1 Tax=Scytonema sp. NUACC26 TaxID=3140176 RepID=UPI0034DC4D0C
MFAKQSYTAIGWLILVIISNPAFAEQALSKTTLPPPDEAKSEVQSLSEVQSAETLAHYLLRTPRKQNFVPKISQATTDVVLVTDVKVNSTDKGIELILVTANSQKLQVSPKTDGNSYIVDIPNAKLQLASGESFQQLKPAVGIAEVTVVTVDAKALQVRVVGETSAPTVELFDSTQEGLVFGVTSTASTANQPTQTPQQKPQTQHKQPPIELDVTAPPDSYRVPNATVTKTDTPLRDIPRSVQVLPRQVLEDIGAGNIFDVLRTVGVGTSSPAFSSLLFDNFRFRGFVANNRRNGLREITTGFAADPANIERIEILRGPASVLYGQITPGGVVNRITKQPLSSPYYFAQMRVGTDETYQPSIDISGPLNSERTLLYRLNADYFSTQSFVDFYNEQRYFVAPAFTWQIARNTMLTVNGEYQDNEKPNGDGIGVGQPAVGTVLPNPNGKISRSHNFGEPSTDSDFRHRSIVAYNFEHRFNEDWTVRNAFQFRQDVTKSISTSGTVLRPDNRILNRSTAFLALLQNVYYLDTNVVGQFNTGSVVHKLLFGFDFSWDDTNIQVDSYARNPINVFNPIYNSPLGSRTLRSDTLNSNNLQGLYVQDQISLTDNIKFLLGGRFDWLTNNSLNRVSGVQTSQSDSAFSPQVGIVFQPNTNVSLYASYSRSFTQVTGNDAQGNAFKPSRGIQYEIGVKTDWFDNKLSTTLALFDLSRTNITTADPNPNNRNFNVQTGEQRSRGVELITTGELAPGWNIIASYTYLDARVTRDNTFRVGNFFDSTPEHSASLWTTYIIPRGVWKGFGGGLGVYYVGDRFADLANTFTLPSYVRTDAALYYRRNNLRVQLNFQNLFNILYYDAARARNQVYPGIPFEAQLSVSWEF